MDRFATLFVTLLPELVQVLAEVYRAKSYFRCRNESCLLLLPGCRGGWVFNSLTYPFGVARGVIEKCFIIKVTVFADGFITGAAVGRK